MKILTDRRIKRLFCLAALLVAGSALLSAALIGLQVAHAALYVLAVSLCMGTAVLVLLFLYFRDQHQRMERAVVQIKEYIAGDQAARIECDDEGELYRLFHEVNSLVSILNAHAENERRAKGFLKETISDISHQLKTPLAALNIYNGILQEAAEDAPTVKQFADLSEQELDRIEDLVQNLLKITKLDAGTIVLEKAAENVSDMMARVERHFAFQAGQEEKSLSFSGDPAATLLCDRSWLLEAVSNIVKNALDHTKAGDVISVTWRSFASVVQIVVKDNGSGIHPEDLHHIFKRFYRSRFSKDTQGVGLGLPLAKAIVEAHSGIIEVDSAPGAGTAFTMNFFIAPQ